MLFILTIALVQLAEVTRGRAFSFYGSEGLMQTLPVAQLKETPLQSLWYLHKQPPVLDAIRAAAAQFFSDDNPRRLARNVDKVLSWLWSAFLGASVVLVYVWTSRCCPRPVAILAGVLWMLHPAAMLYTRYFDSTLLSSVLTLWLFYELWRLAKGGGSTGRLTLVAVLAFYTRTIYQWYFFPVLLLSLVLVRVPWRRVALFAAIAAVAIAPYIVRQYLLFGTTSTTTFAGDHKCSIIWYQPTAGDIERAKSSLNLAYPTDADLYSGSDPWNTERQYEENLVYSKLFTERLAGDPAGSLAALWKSFRLNWNQYWKPSSAYGVPRSLVGPRLPELYDFTFSGYMFIALLLVSAAIWIAIALRRGRIDFRRVLGLLIPLAYVFLISSLCNRYDPNSGSDRPEWTEAERMKFFLEPIFFLFIVTQLATGVRIILDRLPGHPIGGE